MPTILKSTVNKQTHINRGSAKPNPTWRRAALAAVKRLAQKREHLTSADVLDALQRSGARTHDLRAIGGIMTEARDRGLIEHGGFVRRRDAHKRSITVFWRSRVIKAVGCRIGRIERDKLRGKGTAVSGAGSKPQPLDRI
jgi:hypothetical protein